VAAAPHAAIGDFGVDLAAGDHGVRPGDDFFAYANGKWYESFVIPADHSSFGPFNELEEISTEHVRSIIEAAAAAHPASGTPGQQIGDYYASFMDEPSIESAGLAPAQADLKRIAAATSREALARVFALPGFASLFDIDLPPDLHNPDRYAVVISEAGLGLPDRDYYLSEDATLKALREKYLAYLGQMLSLAGTADAAARARDILAPGRSSRPSHRAFPGTRSSMPRSSPGASSWCWRSSPRCAISPRCSRAPRCRRCRRGSPFST
jgi:predicted metalloendopeptidase